MNRSIKDLTSSSSSSSDTDGEHESKRFSNFCSVVDPDLIGLATFSWVRIQGMPICRRIRVYYFFKQNVMLNYTILFPENVITLSKIVKIGERGERS